MTIPALLLLAPLQGPGSGYAVGRFRLEGPLEEVVFEAGPEGRLGVTRLRGELGPGERREVRLPLPVGELGPVGDPGPGRIVPIGGGARFLGFEPEGVAWKTLPARLRVRTRPPLGAPRPRVSRGALPWLAVGGLAAWFARRRVLVGLAVGALAGLAGGAFCMLFQSQDARGIVRVLEGDASSGRWLSVEAGRGALELRAFDERPPVRVESVPRGAAVLWQVELAGATRRVHLSAPGAGVVVARELEPRELSRGSNRWGRFEEVWLRSASGTWSGHGAWAVGGELAPPDERAAAPPGFLATGLPQGIPVFVGRLAEGEPGTRAFEGLDPGITYLRATGF